MRHANICRSAYNCFVPVFCCCVGQPCWQSQSRQPPCSCTAADQCCFVYIASATDGGFTMTGSLSELTLSVSSCKVHLSIVYYIQCRPAIGLIIRDWAANVDTSFMVRRVKFCCSTSYMCFSRFAVLAVPCHADSDLCQKTWEN